MGSGKTLAGKEIAKKVGGVIIISAPSLPILQQWREEMADVPDVHYYTFQTLCRTNGLKCDLLIVDESHRSVSPEFIKLYDNVKYKNILGLSATPSPLAIEKCGPVFVKVNFDEAKVAPFVVHFFGINLTEKERFEYKKLSYSIAQYYNKERLTPQEKEILDAIIIKRRHLVYSAEARFPVARALIQQEASQGKKILVICRRVEQAEQLANAIPEIPHIQYHSGHMGDLNLYREGKVLVCISVGMLYTGFNDIETNVGIVVSTPISKSFHYQSIGRIIRYKKGKSADIYVILANDTTDTQVLNFRTEYDHTLTNIKIPVPFEDSIGYYKGLKFSFGSNQIWRKLKPEEVKPPLRSQREFFKFDPAFYKKLQAAKPGGGSFVVTSKGVFTKVEDDQIVKVCDEIPTFTPKEVHDIPKTFDEVFLPKEEKYAYKGGELHLIPNLKNCHWKIYYGMDMREGTEPSKAQARKVAEHQITIMAGY